MTATATGAPIDLAQVRHVYSSRHGSVEALRDIDLGVRPGEFVTLIGPSGCGKSTLLMQVAGLLLPTSGDIRIGERLVRGPQTHVGIAFQDPVLLDWRDALGNVLLQAEARGLPMAEYRGRAMRLLARAGLAGSEHKPPYELSGGMKQRVALCRALIHDPTVLLMDEPFGALDALTRDQLMVDLQDLWWETKKTVLFVTHSIAEAVFLSDRVVVMTPRPGRIDREFVIELPRPRTLRTRDTADFTHYTRLVTELFESRGVLAESRRATTSAT